MDFQDVVRRRRMVRSYEDRPLPADVVERILANALRAPSAGFSQGWAFLALTEADDRRRFWDAVEDQPSGHSEGLRRAPLIVVVLSDKQVYLDRYAEPDKGWTDRSEAHWPVPYWDIDAGFAALLMHLTAIDAGLGSCFIGIPPSRIPHFRVAFGVPDRFTPIGFVTAGYPASDRPSPSLKRGHRPVDQVIHRGTW